MPKTTNQKRYDHFIQSGMDTYQNAVDTKSAKNTIKFSLKSLKYFESAMNMATLVNMTDRIPYVNEYCVLNHALIGNAHFQEKSLADSVDSFNLALEINQNTLKNQETIIRENYIVAELLKIAMLQQDGILARKFARKILSNAQKLKDLKKQIKYYRIAIQGFIDSQNETELDKAWKMLLKAGKGAKTEELLPLQADILVDYGKFLLKKQEQDQAQTSGIKSSKIIKYFEKAKKIYQKIDNEDKVATLEKQLQSIDH